MNKITWIASFPKSGNTWVRSLISAYLNKGQLDINTIMPLNDKTPFYYENILSEPIQEWELIDQALVKPVALLKMLKESKANLMLKSHDCNVEISGASQIPTDLTLSSIYIVRDPRDVALSVKNHYGCKNNAEAVEKILDDNFITRQRNDGLLIPQLSWKLNVNSWMRELPYPSLTIRYEDLLAATDEVFTEIIKFLKLPYNEDLISICVDNCSFDNMQKQELKHGFKESMENKQFFYKGKAQRWKTDLEPELQDKITQALGPEMKKLGYL